MSRPLQAHNAVPLQEANSIPRPRNTRDKPRFNGIVTHYISKLYARCRRLLRLASGKNIAQTNGGQVTPRWTATNCTRHTRSVSPIACPCKERRVIAYSETTTALRRLSDGEREDLLIDAPQGEESCR